MRNQSYPFLDRKNDELISFKPKNLWMCQMESTKNPVEPLQAFGILVIVATAVLLIFKNFT